MRYDLRICRLWRFFPLFFLWRLHVILWNRKKCSIKNIISLESSEKYHDIFCLWMCYVPSFLSPPPLSFNPSPFPFTHVYFKVEGVACKLENFGSVFLDHLFQKKKKLSAIGCWNFYVIIFSVEFFFHFSNFKKTYSNNWIVKNKCIFKVRVKDLCTRRTYTCNWLQQPLALTIQKFPSTQHGI